jgi:hypothetical protein
MFSPIVVSFVAENVKSRLPVPRFYHQNIGFIQGGVQEKNSYR